MLENEMKRLTAAIEKLNANLEAVLATPVPAAPVAPTPEPEQKEAEQPEQAPAELSFNDVTGMCLALSRKDAKNKDAIRALLDDFGAKKVSDLGGNLAAFAAKLEQL